MNTYIMRWNPGISSSKIEDYREAAKAYPEGFCGVGSIYEHENAHEGDEYYMMRVGEGSNGIVYHGDFLSDPYLGEDWAGTEKKRYYVDIFIEDPCDPDKPCITVEELEEAIPEITWRRGHSGELITPEQAEKLKKLLASRLR